MQIKYSGDITEPLSATTVKEYLKVDFTDEDTFITSLITGVRELIEEYTGRALVVKTIEYFEKDYSRETVLPYPEHDSITEVKVNGTATTDFYTTGLTQKIITLATYNEVQTSLNDKGLYVKYTTLANCPQGIKTEMLRLIAEKYRNRGNTFVGSIASLDETSYKNLAQYLLF
jgi:uncharacterized phiE125 gp8 family phage protein